MCKHQDVSSILKYLFEINIYFCQKYPVSTPCLIFLIPFVILLAEFLQWILNISKPHLAVNFTFPACKNICNKYEQSGSKSCIINSHTFHNITITTNSNFLFYLIWLCQDRKLKNSMKRKLQKKKAAALSNMRNFGRNQSRNMRQNAFFPCQQGIRMRMSTRENRI